MTGGWCCVTSFACGSLFPIDIHGRDIGSNVRDLAAIPTWQNCAVLQIRQAITNKQTFTIVPPILIDSNKAAFHIVRSLQ